MTDLATSDSDPTAVGSAGIAGHSFSRSRHGYSQDEVDRYLRVIDDHVSELQTELAWHRARSDHLARRESAAEEAAYARLSRQFADVVRAADQAGAHARDEAEAEAAAILARAREEAEGIVAAAAGPAQEEADGIVSAAISRANEEAAEIVKTAEVRASQEADRIMTSAVSRAKEQAASIIGAAAAGRPDDLVVIDSEAEGDLADLDLEVPEFDLSLDMPEEVPADPFAPSDS